MATVRLMRRGSDGATMSNCVARGYFILLLVVHASCFAVTDEFTVENPVTEKSEKSGDRRRYTQVRDELLELLAQTMESSTVLIEQLAELQIALYSDGDLSRETSQLIKQLAQLGSEICGITRKIAEGVSGMSCKRLKNVEKKFKPIPVILKNGGVTFGEKKLEKTGKSGETSREKLRADVKRMNQDLSILIGTMQ